MTNFDTTLSDSPHHEGHAIRPLHRMWNLTRRRLQFRTLMREVANVEAMPDHMLRDIGLNRADIVHAVRTGRLPDR